MQDMGSSAFVAKKKQPADGPAPMFFATVAYKQWARAKWEATGWSLKELARQLKRINPAVSATDGGLGLFFGSKDEPAGPSNCSFMREMNKLFGAAPPPICDPNSPISQIRDRLEARWAKLTPREQRSILELLSDE